MSVETRDPQRPRRRRHGGRAGAGRRRSRAEVGSSPSEPSPRRATEIDAAGKVVAPGFIDIHSHSDFTLLVDPRAASAIHQGVTTEIVGNCGFGCFPLLNKELAPKAIYGHSDDVPLTWRFGRRLLRAARGGGAGDQRARASYRTGRSASRSSGWPTGPARPDELQQMRYLLDEALEQGAWGYSTGLEYAAERGADEDELVSMCEVCGRRHGLYATHTRRRDEGADEAVAEALRTARALRGAAAGLPPRAPQRNRLGAALRRARRGSRARAAWTSPSTCTRGCTGRRSCSRRCRRGRSRIPSRLREILASKEQRREMRGYESILSAGGDWSRIVLLDNDVWPGLRPPRCRVDRGRARPGAARRRLRPAARRLPTIRAG